MNSITKKLPIGANLCRCSGCGEHFRSVGAFEMHRAGSYQPLTRRCLTIDEMRAAGMVRRADGFWTTGRSAILGSAFGHSSHDRTSPLTDGAGA